MKQASLQIKILAEAADLSSIEEKAMQVVLQYDEGNGKSRPKTMPKFSACIEHVGGP
jgi:hypothetical protein